MQGTPIRLIEDFSAESCRPKSVMKVREKKKKVQKERKKEKKTTKKNTLTGKVVLQK